MITRQRLITFGIPSAAIATVTAAALLTSGKPASTSASDPMIIEPEPVAAGDGTPVDVVFAVDTTGSMGPLIEGAKRTVWSIATHIKNTDPNANIRIGLVAFRDVGDDYVTKPFALTNDLDAVYTELSGYTADGGNDIPENVDAALHDALKMKWRPGAKKIVFLVGDAPPASRGDVPTFDVLAKQAQARGITINTIRAGNEPATEQKFRQIAMLANGEFSTIHQDGGVQQVATPYDAKMAELSAEIDRGAIIVGDEGKRAGYASKMAAAEAAPAPAKADRATYFAKGKAAPRAADDLVGGVATGSMDLDKVSEADLPADLRGKDKAQLKAEVEKRVAQRKAAQAELEQLAKQRDEYLAKNAKKTDGGSFDAKVKETVEKQLKSK